MASEPGGGPVETPWRSLHPASVLVNLLPQSIRLLRGAWVVILAIAYGSRDGVNNAVDLGLLLFFFFGTVGQTVLHYLTLRYRVHGGRLELVTGLFNRQVRSIDPERIQNTELVRSIPHKIAGLVEVRIETASGTEVEGLLSALTVADAEALVNALEAARQRAEGRRGQAEVADAPGEVLVAHDLWAVLRYGATSTQVGAFALVMVGVGVDVVAWVAPEAAAQLRGLGAVGGLALVAAVLSASWLGGVGSAFLLHYRFELSRVGARIVAQRGLFTRRRVEVRREKLQVVTWVEPLVRRLLGFGSVVLESAAARPGAGGVEAATTLVPVVDAPRLDALLHALLPGDPVPLEGIVLRPPHRNALLIGLLGNVLRASIFAGGVTWLAWPWGLVAWLTVPLGVVFAVLDFRAQGWLVTERYVVARQGYWNRQTALVARSKLQSLDLRQGPLEALLGTGRLVLRVAGSGVALPEIGFEEAEDTLYALTGKQEPA